MLHQITAFPLRPARVHEACGSLAIAFAAVSAVQAGGSLLWVRADWRSGTVTPAGLGSYLDPSRLLLAQAADQAEILAVAEEGLRDRALSLVVMEPTAPIGLTAGRRLQLAAQAGQTTGLCLIPEGMGSPAVETRWRCSPVADPDRRNEDSTLQIWQLIKNKSGTLGAWHVRWNAEARRLAVVSPAGK